MLCPADKSILQTHDGGGPQIHFCELCHGIWLDREQLVRMVRNPTGTVVPSKPTAPVRLPASGARACPDCAGSVLTARIVDGVEIDVCPRCHGIWLDSGELDLIVARYRRKQRSAAVANNGSDILADIATDPGFLWDMIETLSEGLGKSADWASDALPALLEFIGDAFSSLDL